MILRKLSIIKIYTFFFVLPLLFAQSLFAQGLDQNIFDQIRKQTGAQTAITQVKSPLDQLREQDYLTKLNLQLENRLKAGPSIIEKDYNERLGKLDSEEDTHLEQFGYSIFDRLPLQNQIMTGTVPDDYILGVGDELIINFKGSKEEIISAKIDREGRLVVPSLSPLTAAGLTVAQIRQVLEKQVSESLIGTEIFISVASLRQISVLVAGEVENPSVVSIHSLASPIEVLLHVGGVKKTGSLRNITLLRGDQRIPIDLYKIVEGTNAEIFNLKNGDRLIVPTIASTIALDGNVIRPGIYELPNGDKEISASSALALSGGTLRNNGNSFTHMQFDTSGRTNFQKLNLNGNIKSGEIVIVNLFENSQAGKITLAGHVKTPGVRSFANFTTVKLLIGNVKNLTENPYLLFGIIERTDLLTQTRLLIPFNLQKIIFGTEDLDLNDGDKVYIYSRNDVEFLKSNAVRQAVLTSTYLEEEFLDDGEINYKYCAPVKKLSEIIADTQSDRFGTAIRAVFVRRESDKEQQNERTQLLDDTELLAIERQKVQALSTIPISANNTNFEEDEEDEEELNNYAYCPPIYQEVNNLLSFTLEHIISMDGAVRLPGVYPIAGNISVDLLLAVSGGTSNDANMSRIEVTSYRDEAVNGNLVMNWEYVDGSISKLDNVEVSAGGGVRVSSVYTNFESGAVLISGEFIQPGVYTIRKGEKLSELIKRAGGLTEQSYPYGAIFTRNRVKEMQSQEMQQTARRLQSAIVSASVKKNVDASGAVVLQRMVNQMAEQEFLGRVVIESDPVVLALDPNKDIVLEAGDSLFMPKRPSFIVTVGDVLNPSALQFIPGKGVSSYLEEVGGFTSSADEDRVFVVYPNGVARPINLSSWGGDRNLSIPPGSSIVIPTDLSPYDNLTLIREFGDIFRNLAVSAASIAILVRN